MYPRKYSLNKPNKVLRYGQSFETANFIFKIIKKTSSKQENAIQRAESLINKQISVCIIISNKFSKNTVVRSYLKRRISEGLVNNYNLSIDIVIIPKKNLLTQNGKIAVDAKTISSQIDTFLSKLAIA